MVLTKSDSVVDSHTHIFAALVVGSNEASSEEASQLLKNVINYQIYI